MEEAEENRKFKEAVQEEVQRLLASRETLGLPEGKIELTPVAQKAIDGYLFKWLKNAGMLFTLLAGALGYLGLGSMSASVKRVDSDVKLVAETAGKASALLKGFETDLADSLTGFETDLDISKDELSAIPQ